MNAPMNKPKGQRRKFWSWGYEGQDIPESEVTSMHERVAKRLGMSDFTILKDPTLDEIEIRAPRITPPASLASFCTTEKWDRVAHTYGKSFRDIAMIYKRKYPNPPDVVAYPRDEKDICGGSRLVWREWVCSRAFRGWVECHWWHQSAGR